jgi:hypothetical protein
MQRTTNPAQDLESFGRVRTRPVLVLKATVTKFDGELLDPRTGVVLAPEEAYETFHGPVKEEPLGSVPPVDDRRTPF